MSPNERIEQQHVTSDNPYKSDEVITKTVTAGPREVGLSPGTLIVIVLLAIVALGTVFYVINNKNVNEEANRQAAIEASRIQADAQTRAATAQQSQAPLVVQQPTAPPAPPVIIQQSAPQTETKNVMDDSTMAELANKRLMDDASLTTLSVSVVDGKATLIGTVTSKDLKNRAEKIVKGVRGIKSVDNSITVSE